MDTPENTGGFSPDQDLMLDLALNLWTLVELKLGFSNPPMSQDTLLKCISNGDRFQFVCWSAQIVNEIEGIKKLQQDQARGKVKRRQVCSKAWTLCKMIENGCQQLKEHTKTPQQTNHLNGLKTMAIEFSNFLSLLMSTIPLDFNPYPENLWMGDHVVSTTVNFMDGLLDIGKYGKGIAAYANLESIIQQFKDNRGGLFNKQILADGKFQVGWVYTIDLHDENEGDAVQKIRTAVHRWQQDEIRLGNLCMIFERQTSRLDFLKGDPWDEVQRILANLWITTFGKKFTVSYLAELPEDVRESVSNDINEITKRCLSDKI